jgi:outer membrane immunogenic protein
MPDGAKNGGCRRPGCCENITDRQKKAFQSEKLHCTHIFGRQDPLLIDSERRGDWTMKKLLLAAVAVVGLAAGPAVAADLGRRAPAYIPPPAPPAPSFTGCYVNGGAGYGLWNIDHFSNTDGFTTNTATSGGRGWLGTVGGGCDYQFSPASGWWSNWAVGAFADYDFMDLHRNFQESSEGGIGDAKEKSAWAVGGRIGYLVTPNVFTYWNGGYTETRFDQINLSDLDGDGTPVGSIGSHTYHGWFIGGGTEIALSGLFGLPLPSGLFWRSEYRFSSFSSADLPLLDASGFGRGTINMHPYVQTITTSLVWKFNWWGH